jgi:hypothetical protein
MSLELISKRVLPLPGLKLGFDPARVARSIAAEPLPREKMRARSAEARPREKEMDYD